MGMNIKFNPTQLEASISNIAERAAKNASEEMRRAAIKIRDLARDFAPVKTGTLERSIDYATIKGAKRRNVFVVYVDLDLYNPKGKKQVGEYAWIMEEQLHPFGRRRGKLYYKLGTKSQEKADSGKKVGGKFLKRAIDIGTQDLVNRCKAEVRRTLSSKRAIPMSFERAPGENDE